MKAEGKMLKAETRNASSPRRLQNSPGIFLALVLAGCATPLKHVPSPIPPPPYHYVLDQINAPFTVPTSGMLIFTETPPTNFILLASSRADLPRTQWIQITNGFATVTVPVKLILSYTNPPEFYLQLFWNPNPDPNLAGYKIYWGTNSGTYTRVINVGRTTNAELRGLAGQRYYLAATSYTTNGIESPFSTELATPAREYDPPLSVFFTAFAPVLTTLSSPAGKF